MFRIAAGHDSSSLRFGQRQDPGAHDAALSRFFSAIHPIEPQSMFPGLACGELPFEARTNGSGEGRFRARNGLLL